ncbi:hypothetical protein C8A00DRAFT_18750 [Chaetomidium leptoderma]|uniref:NmrA-like domain-containing protein n=1 Tax=Chaetomidium leptoderma TaxID=669021 RepID=A0AAN6VDQ0_9PEZI|nr:hypothetical protein C8A00DRAFT_18750 [Chaetomidium leptoderma]
MTKHNVFVCGATGTQGGAVARQLRAIGWEVRTTTRDANSPAAQALASIGVKVHAGPWSDTAAIESAMTGCDLFFLNLVPDMTNPNGEIQDAKNMLRIAKAAGVRHIVYNSGIHFPEQESSAYAFIQLLYQAKAEIEKEVQAAGFPHWTIPRPGFFMSNFLVPNVHMLYPGATETGLFTMAFRPHTELPMIDPEDIGAFVVAAFQNPDKFHGQAVNLISQMVAVETAMETMRRATGRNIRAQYLTDAEIAEATATNPLLAIQEVLRDAKGAAALDETWGIETGTFEGYVEREKKAFEETYRSV